MFDSNLTTLASSVTLTSDYVSARPRHRPPTRSFHTSRMLEHRATIVKLIKKRGGRVFPFALPHLLTCDQATRRSGSSELAFMPGYHLLNVSRRSPFITWARTCNSRWAPSSTLATPLPAPGSALR